MDSVANIHTVVVEGNRNEARVSESETNGNNEEKEKNFKGLDSVDLNSDVDARVLEESGEEKEIVGISESFDDVGNGKNSSFVQFDTESDNLDQEDDELQDGGNRVESKGEVYNSLLSEFDDFVANEKNEALVGTSRALSYGFEVGDMVWGKVKSHPWWPGHIFNEEIATSSVRRTRREGHVLVAFFGDSSYGWFDPAELIPFDSHFAEKSQQTNSRTFVKAVEEAVDEASRRAALGLVCKCRNRYNFRPTNVEGYLAVDVPEYEAGGVYSMKQICKSQGEFLPGHALNFVKQVALGPQQCDQTLIDFIKNKATVNAYRKAVFEEFDETYAQAFGPPSSRALKDPKSVTDRSVKEPSRAPLSGPLVIAEALGSGKSSKKLIKVKEHSKKDKYLLKRRDEIVDSESLQVGSEHSDSSDLAAYIEDLSAPMGENFILQKRVPDPQISVKQEQTGLISGEASCPGEDSSGKQARIMQVSGYNIGLVNEGDMLDGKQTFNKESGAQQDETDDKGSTVVVRPTIMVSSDESVKELSLGVTDPASSFPQEVEMVDRIKQENAKASKLSEDPQQSELISVSRADPNNWLDNSRDGQASSRLPPLSVKNSVGVGPDGVVKKKKVVKRPLEESSADQSPMGEKKKKKKKDLGGERPKKPLAPGKVGVLVGKSSHDSFFRGSDTGVNTPLGNVAVAHTEPELPQLLNDLHALAVDPFHGMARYGPYVSVRFFLRVRSLVYQKSLVLPSQSDSESADARAAKSGPSDSSAEAIARKVKPSKVLAKSLGRPDDPTVAGRKRLPSDRQDEIAAKRLKKINQLKSLAAEKRVGLKTLETPRAEGKESAATTSLRPSIRTDHVKKMHPPKSVEPTMLVIKFPQGYNLPSVAELKARFARFGSIDQSAIRVLWKSSTCRVVFRFKSDAQAAYRYAVKNTSLFGNVEVRYLVREVETTTEAPESDKGRADDTSNEAPLGKDPVYERPTPPLAPLLLAQSAVQPKSILKKPPSSSNEAGQVSTGGNGGRGISRVKFMLGGEDQMNRNNFNNTASFGDGGGAPTSSVAMDNNSKNLQKVIPPSTLPPILPTPSQFSKPSFINKSQYHTDGPPRNLQILNHGPSPTTPSSKPSVDISQQMLSLLARCNDVVIGVRGLLGYVPYHPL